MKWMLSAEDEWADWKAARAWEALTDEEKMRRTGKSPAIEAEIAFAAATFARRIVLGNGKARYDGNQAENSMH